MKEDRFVTYRNKEHFMRKYNGFGISKKVLERVIEPQASEIVVIYNCEDGTQDVFKTTPREC